LVRVVGALLVGALLVRTLVGWFPVGWFLGRLELCWFAPW